MVERETLGFPANCHRDDGPTNLAISITFCHVLAGDNTVRRLYHVKHAFLLHSRASGYSELFYRGKFAVLAALMEDISLELFLEGWRDIAVGEQTNENGHYQGIGFIRKAPLRSRSLNGNHIKINLCFSNAIHPGDGRKVTHHS